MSKKSLFVAILLACALATTAVAGQDPVTEKVYRPQDGVTLPVLRSKIEPEIPLTMRNKKFQGVVGLNVVVDSKGRVGDVKVTHSLGKALDDNAIDAVKHWRFKPAKKDGVPVPVAVYIEVAYRIN
jgi:TonB family protein